MSSGKKPGGGSFKGQRQLHTNVRTAKGRKTSSTQWLQRQLNDPYVAQAKRDGYRSRAAYKIKEINERYPIFRKGQCVVDLGAAPGGWTQVVVDLVKSDQPGGGKVVGIDLQAMEPIPGATLIQCDFMTEEALTLLNDALEGNKPDVVMSDMAAASCGHRQTDHLRIIGLCEAALSFAVQNLAPGGAFVAKILKGGMESQLLQSMKQDFASVRHVKPPSSRADSAESYVVALGFRGGDKA